MEKLKKIFRRKAEKIGELIDTECHVQPKFFISLSTKRKICKLINMEYGKLNKKQKIYLQNSIEEYLINGVFDSYWRTVE